MSKLTKLFVASVAFFAAASPVFAAPTYYRITTQMTPDPCPAGFVSDKSGCISYSTSNWGGDIDPILGDESAQYTMRVAKDGTTFITEMTTDYSDPNNWVREWYFTTVSNTGVSTRVRMPDAKYPYRIVAVLNDNTVVASTELDGSVIRFVSINPNGTTTNIELPEEFYNTQITDNGKLGLVFDQLGNAYTLDRASEMLTRYNFKTGKLEMDFYQMDVSKYYYRLVIDRNDWVYLFYTNSNLYSGPDYCHSDAAGYFRIDKWKGFLNYGGEYKFTCHPREEAENFLGHGGSIKTGLDGRMYTSYYLPKTEVLTENYFTRTSLSTRLTLVHPDEAMMISPAMVSADKKENIYAYAGTTKFNGQLLRISNDTWYYKEIADVSNANGYTVMDIDLSGNIYLLKVTRDGSLPTTLSKISFGS